MLEQERQRIEQLTAGWDDPTQVDWGGEEHAEATPAVAVSSAPETDDQAPVIYKCVALYSYTVRFRYQLRWNCAQAVLTYSYFSLLSGPEPGRA